MYEKYQPIETPMNQGPRRKHPHSFAAIRYPLVDWRREVAMLIWTLAALHETK